MTYIVTLLFEKYRAHSLRPARDAQIDSLQRVEDLHCMLMRQLDNIASSRSFANG